MGIYLNVGKDGFRESVASSIYVDKTGFIRAGGLLGEFQFKQPGRKADP